MNSIKINDDLPIQIRPNYGVGIIATLFGCKYEINRNSMPWVQGIGSAEKVKEIVANGVPDLTSGLGKSVIECLDFFHETLQRYPKCYDIIKITQPDLQGPLDIVHLIIGNDLFYYLYNEKNLLHELLELVSTAYIDFRRLIDKYLKDQARETGYSYIHNAIYKGKVLIKDDISVNLPLEHYKKFSKPYNEKILAVYPGRIHHCGDGNQWHKLQLETKNLLCLDFGNSESQNLDQLFPKILKIKLPIVNYGRTENEELLRRYDFTNNINTGITLCIRADDEKKARNILKMSKS